MRGVQDSLDPHTGSWRCQPVPLNFRLGELTLFSPRLPLYVCTRHLTELPEDWEDPLEPLADLPTGTEGILFRSHPTRRLLRRLRWISGTIRYVPSQYERFYVDLDRSTEEYLKTFSSKSRSTLKRKMRRFADFSGGDIHWREYRSVREMEEFYATARRVSAMTYQEKLLNAGLPDSASFRKKMLELAERDEVRGYLL